MFENYSRQEGRQRLFIMKYLAQIFEGGSSATHEPTFGLILAPRTLGDYVNGGGVITSLNHLNGTSCKQG